MGELLLFPVKTPRGQDDRVPAAKSKGPAVASIADITGNAPMPPHMARVLGEGEPISSGVILPFRFADIDEAEAASDGGHVRRTACARPSSWRESVCDAGSTVAFHFFNLLQSLGELWRALRAMPSADKITIGERTPPVSR